jgi:hypothetical protein
MQPLEAMQQHRTVSFFEDVVAHLENVVRANPNQVVVEGGMVQPASSRSRGILNGSELCHRLWGSFVIASSPSRRLALIPATR